MYSIVRQLQNNINKLQKWAVENGFTFSFTKTVCVHFCQRRGLHPDPELFIEEARIPVVGETKFLGLIFDRKLSFLPHINYVKKKCQKALDLLKVVAHNNWGADHQVLLQLYQSLVLSKLDYGSMVYGSARPSYIRWLNPIQNQGLRLSLGAFRTSPEVSLEVEAHQMPLDLRRQKLALQYAIKVAANPGNPAYKCVFEPDYVGLFERKPNAIPTFGIRIQEQLQELSFDPTLIANFHYPEVPPWLCFPTVNLSLAE